MKSAYLETERSQTDQYRSPYNYAGEEYNRYQRYYYFQYRLFKNRDVQRMRYNPIRDSDINNY